MGNRRSIVDHLESDYQKPIRDPLWKHIYVSEAIQKLLDAPACRQLTRIKQLGPAYLVYPGATHTRMSHSLGVFDIARRMIRRLLAVSGDIDLSLEGVKAFLAAALLHDLGHFPYTHSFKELPLLGHEVLTGQLVRSDPIRSLLRHELRTDAETVAAIVDTTIAVAPGGEVALFRALLSGALDPDKLDYLNRDAYFCGVPYGIQDIDFILSRLHANGHHGVALESSGISAIENILFSKYLMYRAVYWHRTVRVATAMIKKAVYQALRQEVIVPQDLYGLDDDLFFVQFARRDFLPFDLIRRVYDRVLHQPVWETAYDAAHPLHRDLTDMHRRHQLEDRIAARLDRQLRPAVRPEAVIIDVPEDISFEVDLAVLHNGTLQDYRQSETVFTGRVVADFTRTLRRVRLMLSPEIAAEVRNPERLLES
ncbi:MAG: HD domain-containing protein [Spirochaetaceae bacterium]|nr:MAG: HD domain-containing protein [Spirochaetaceae bacterium]